MYPKFEEESVIFISILKWSALSAVVGVIVGLSTTLFLKLLTASIDFLNQFSLSYLLLPAALLTSALLIRYLTPAASGCESSSGLQLANLSALIRIQQAIRNLKGSGALPYVAGVGTE